MSSPHEVLNRGEILTGYGAAVAAAFSYGTGALLAQKVVADYAPPIVGSAFSLLFGLIFVAALLSRQAARDISVAPKLGMVFLVAAGTSSAVGVGFYFLALDHGPVVLVAPLVGASPLVTIALSHVFLQRLEKVTWRMVLGATLVVAGVAIVALGRG